MYSKKIFYRQSFCARFLFKTTPILASSSFRVVKSVDDETTAQISRCKCLPTVKYYKMFTSSFRNLILISIGELRETYMRRHTFSYIIGDKSVALGLWQSDLVTRDAQITACRSNQAQERIQRSPWTIILYRETIDTISYMSY